MIRPLKRTANAIRYGERIPQVKLSIQEILKRKPPVAYRKISPVRYFLWLTLTLLLLAGIGIRSAWTLWHNYQTLSKLGWRTYLSKKYNVEATTPISFITTCERDAKCKPLIERGVIPSGRQALLWILGWAVATAFLLRRQRLDPSLSMRERLATYEDLKKGGFIERRPWEELIDRYLKPKEEHTKGPAGYAGTFVDDDKNVHFLRLPPNIATLHTLTIGGTGFGKTVSVFYPRLLLDAIEGAVAMVLDIKYPNPDDSYISARDFFYTFKRRVWVINPFRAGEGLNVPILKGVRKPEEANTVAYYLYPPGMEDQVPEAAVYISNARKVLAAIIYALANYDPENLSFAKIHDIANRGGQAIQAWFGKFRDANSLVESTLGLKPDILNGVLNRLAVDTEMFTRPEVDETFRSGSNDLDLELVFTRPGMVHIVFPEVELRGEAGEALLRLLKQWLDAQLLKLAEKHGGSLPIPVRAYYDEFYVFGKLPNIAKDFGTFRSRNITLHLAMQNLAMPEQLYEKEWEAAANNNIGLTTLLAGSLTDEEAQEWAKRIGETTVPSTHVTEGKHIEPFELGELGHSGSAAIRETRRPLITPQELRQMPIGTAISMTRGIPPIVTHLPRLQDPWSPLHSAYLRVVAYRERIQEARSKLARKKALDRARFQDPSAASYDDARAIFEEFLNRSKGVREKTLAVYGRIGEKTRRFEITKIAQAVLDPVEINVLVHHGFLDREGNSLFLDTSRVPYALTPINEWFAVVSRNNVVEEHLESPLQEPEGAEDLRPDARLEDERL